MPSDSASAAVPRWRLIAAFAVICLIWGSSWAAVRVGLEGVPPLFAAAARFALATAVLAVIALFRRERIPRDRTFLLLAGFLALSAVTIPFALVYWAQQRIDSGLAAVLFGTFPFWAALFAHAALPRERLSILKVTAVGAGFAGIVVIFRDSPWSLEAGWLSALAIVFSAAIQASSLVAIRKYGGPYSAVMLNLIPMAVGGLLLFAACLTLEDPRNVRITTAAISALLFLATFSTVLTFVLYYWMAKHVPAVLLSFSAIVTPIVAVLTGWMWLGEPITMPLLEGSILVLIGIALVTGADAHLLRREVR